MLGGYHNFEEDRQMAERVRQVLPFAFKCARLQRWCLQDIAIALTKHRNYDVIIDFASGLPTDDHMHHVVPNGTIVIYSDYDPVVVEYGHELLIDTPNVYYFLADARHPEDLIYRPEVLKILGKKRDVAFVSWGISAFLTDEQLAHAAQVLFEWSGDNSCWVFNAQAHSDEQVSELKLEQLFQLYEQMGEPIQFRSLEQYQELLQPWQFDPPGWVSLLEWHGLKVSMMSEQDRRLVGIGGGGYGVYLTKKP
jgi:hypothetical protein